MRHTLGEFNVPCAHCRALKFVNEKNFKCCCEGKVSLPDLLEFPEQLRNLLSSDSAQAKGVRVRISIPNDNIDYRRPLNNFHLRRKFHIFIDRCSWERAFEGNVYATKRIEIPFYIYLLAIIISYYVFRKYLIITKNKKKRHHDNTRHLKYQGIVPLQL